MNLQICVPYQKCKYNCPMCVAKGHTHQYKFYDMYHSNKFLYLWGLKLFQSQVSGNFIITGECDPTQDMEFVTTVAKHLNDKSRVEIQTKNYNIDIDLIKDYIGTLAYSITNFKEYVNARKLKKIPGINRLVILLTKEFDCLNVENFKDFGFDQITFKVLQYGEDPKVNEWIDKNRLENLDNIYEIVRVYANKKCSVRVDLSCQNAEGRYLILRSDGRIYHSWEEV